MASGSWSEDQLLNGRVTVCQPLTGYRVAIDPILLAAAVPAKPGEQVLDLGSGTGVASLCLAARVEGVFITGLELQTGLIDLAGHSAKLSGCRDRVSFVSGDVLDPPAAILEQQFDHVIANPPYMAKESGFPPPDPMKAIAHVEGEAVLADWMTLARKLVKPEGTITFIHRYDRRDELLAGLLITEWAITMYPLWSKTFGGAARRVIIQAHGQRNAETIVAPGLVLHEADGSYTPQVDEVLRNCAPIILSPLAEG